MTAGMVAEWRSLQARLTALKLARGISAAASRAVQTAQDFK
jgi:hypothetical protein